MRAKLRRVGNSIGVTIPANELRSVDANEGDIVELEITNVIRAARAGWNDAATWQGAGTEVLLLDPDGNDFDSQEWEW